MKIDRETMRDMANAMSAIQDVHRRMISKRDSTPDEATRRAYRKLTNQYDVAVARLNDAYVAAVQFNDGDRDGKKITQG